MSWREVAEWDWVWLGDGNVLHAVADVTNDADDDWYGDGTTECGQSGRMTIPGLFSRLGAIRCVRCCKTTGMPQGGQSPKNIAECPAYRGGSRFALFAGAPANRTEPGGVMKDYTVIIYPPEGHEGHE